MIRREENVPLSNKMAHEIASAINRVLFHQMAPGHIRIMKAQRNAKGAITAIAHPNATARIALLYRDIIVPVARMVNNGVEDFEESESWVRLQIQIVLVLRYMGKVTDGIQQMGEQLGAENAGIVIHTQLRWLANPSTIRERRKNRVIAASLVVFVVKGSKVAQRSVNTGMKAAGVWYRVRTYTNLGPESRCELCCAWGHMEDKCGNKP